MRREERREEGREEGREDEGERKAGRERKKGNCKMALAAISVGQTDADADTLPPPPPPPPQKAVVRPRSDFAMRQSGRRAGRQVGWEGEIILSRLAASLCVLAISRENHPSASVRPSSVLGGMEYGMEAENECECMWALAPAAFCRKLYPRSETRPKTCVSGAEQSSFLFSANAGRKLPRAPHGGLPIG